MTSVRERQQRAAARARLAKQMAQRQEEASQRRRKRVVAGIGAAVLLIAVGTFFAVSRLGGSEVDDPRVLPPTADPFPVDDGVCTWHPLDPSQGLELATDVGLPEVPEEPPAGTATMTLATNLGDIEIEVNAGAVPCTYTSMSHLAEQDFYNGSVCPRLTSAEAGFVILQCGNPSVQAGEPRPEPHLLTAGGPTYRFAEENLPVGQDVYYPRGVVAMAKGGDPATTGSQIFIVQEDIPLTALTPDYTVLGTVISGMDIIDQVVAEGYEGQDEGADQGFPNLELVIESATMTEPA